MERTKKTKRKQNITQQMTIKTNEKTWNLIREFTETNLATFGRWIWFVSPSVYPQFPQFPLQIKPKIRIEQQNWLTIRKCLYRLFTFVFTLRNVRPRVWTFCNFIFTHFATWIVQRKNRNQKSSTVTVQLSTMKKKTL